MHLKSDRIYRIQEVDSLSSISLRNASTPYALGVELRDNYALAEKVVILNRSSRKEVVYKDTRIALDGLYANSEFFEVFDFKLASGSPEGILDEPYGMVLTMESARKFFGDEDPVGKFLEVDTLGSYEVRGVLEESRQKSHIQFEALVSLSTMELIDKRREEPRFVDNWETGWGSLFCCGEVAVDIIDSFVG
jgi:putative ABC transport system permease protein